MLGEILSELPRVFTPYNLLLLGQAALTTLLLSAVGCVAGLVFGFGLALARDTRSRPWLPLRLVALLYAEVVRRVPFLVTLMLFFFGAQVVGFDLAPADGGADRHLGDLDRLRGRDHPGGPPLGPAGPDRGRGSDELHPLAAAPARGAAPGLAADPAAGVRLFRALSSRTRRCASQIGVLELTDAGKILNTKGFSSFLVYGTVLVLYFVVSYPLALLGSHLEGRLGAPRHPRPRGALR